MVRIFNKKTQKGFEIQNKYFFILLILLLILLFIISTLIVNKFYIPNNEIIITCFDKTKEIFSEDIISYCKGTVIYKDKILKSNFNHLTYFTPLNLSQYLN